MKRLGLCASKAGLCQLEPLLRCGELEAIAVPAGLIDADRPELLHDPAGHKAMLQQHEDIKAFVKGTVADSAPVVPISAQLGLV